jgi:hypothetical protein
MASGTSRTGGALPLSPLAADNASRIVQPEISAPEMPIAVVAAARGPGFASAAIATAASGKAMVK